MEAKQKLKNKLLITNTFIDNEYLDKYCELIIQNKETKKERPKTQSHHILPKSYFKLHCIEIDNSKNNRVNLLYKNHILAHYYLCLCSKGKFAYSMQNGFFHLINCKHEYKDFNPEQDLEYYQQIYEEYILNLKGFKMKGSTKKKLKEINSIPVQNLETGDVYTSRLEAAKAFNVNSSSIGNACKYTFENINRTCCGYHWISLKCKDSTYSQEERNNILSNLPPFKKKGFKLGGKKPEGYGEKIGAKLKNSKRSEETKRKMSASRLGVPQGEHSENHRQNIRKALLGNKQSQKTKQLKSESLKGKEFIKHSVYCIELDKIFSNSSTASQELGISKTIIDRVCKNNRYNVEGLTFKYIKNIIYIYCPELDEYFETLKDISNKYEGYSHAMISSCITGKISTYKDKHWERVNMYELGIFNKEELIKNLN